MGNSCSKPRQKTTKTNKDAGSTTNADSNDGPPRIPSPAQFDVMWKLMPETNLSNFNQEHITFIHTESNRVANQSQNISNVHHQAQALFYQVLPPEVRSLIIAEVFAQYSEPIPREDITIPDPRDEDALRVYNEQMRRAERGDRPPERPPAPIEPMMAFDAPGEAPVVQLRRVQHRPSSNEIIAREDHEQYRARLARSSYKLFQMDRLERWRWRDEEIPISTNFRLARFSHVIDAEWRNWNTKLLYGERQWNIGLLRVCKQMYIEAMPHVYGGWKIFNLDPIHHWPNVYPEQAFATSILFLNAIGHHGRRHLRRVELTMSRNLNTRRLWAGKEIKGLLQDCTALNDLKIRVHGAGSAGNKYFIFKGNSTSIMNALTDFLSRNLAGHITTRRQIEFDFDIPHWKSRGVNVAVETIREVPVYEEDETAERDSYVGPPVDLFGED